MEVAHTNSAHPLLVNGDLSVFFTLRLRIRHTKILSQVTTEHKSRLYKNPTRGGKPHA